MPKHVCIALIVFLAFFLVIGTAAQSGPGSQPTIWATKPDAAAFEKIVNDRLAAGQKSIDQIVAVKDARTIENTLVPYDEAIRQINIGNYLANMMFQVHPDAAFRDILSTSVGTVRVSLTCRVQQGGTVSDCAVASEDPAGMGVGAAALTLAPTLKLSTWSIEGLPIVGGTIRVPLRLEGPGVTPPPPAPSSGNAIKP